MSRHLLAFLLGELDVIRLICKRPACGGIIEIPIAKISTTKFSSPECPLCGKTLIEGAENVNPILLLANAAQAMKGCRERLDIEFVIPDRPETKTT